ncbi:MULTISPECIES: acyl-ACP desaturase [Nocardia]|uniref:Acyl-ACP desaturase n=1 Tax=Nocardia implantans TaxID=3108168 RepID=A0ABU6B1M0_9NOCA|nr:MULTISPECIES: acyl-ACP desaturase [unclassified Nocardia]MBF6195478.1 acyl-ACP desaturase [Nocardia beijingensis]MEA3532012.1 acyl-ACP desaturase [Nocardia sp. CDC192]MEB3513398.1 acyl-ACP desaturase [Nocardia sp. CDC186]
MQTLLTDRELLESLAVDVELLLRKHVDVADGWQPHDFVPWDDGRNFAFLGGADWAPEQSELSETAKLALTVSVLIADNLPSYHREIGKYLRTGAWWRWVGRWTAEENRHEITIRNYLMVTRSVDPVELERLRMEHMTKGFRRPAMHLLDVLANCAFEEAASAVRHRNTAALGENPLVTAIAERIALDDELQSVFFADLVAAALDLAPDQTVRAIADRVAGFEVPTVTLPDGRSSDVVLAEAGIYDRAKEGELVFAPLLKRWNIFGRTDFGPDGESAREELAHLRD